MKITEKSLIQHCERSELCLHFELKMPKMVNLASFWKTEAFGQTVLPDMSVFIVQKVFKNAKIQIRHFEYFSNNVNCKKSVQDEQ